MKKIISFCIIVALCLGLYGCGNNSKYNLKDAKTSTIDGVSFQYPKEWETLGVVDDLDNDGTKYGTSISFECNNTENESSQIFDMFCLHVEVVYYTNTADHIKWEESTAERLGSTFKILDNIDVAGQVCYHAYQYHSDDANCEYYYFDSPKGMVEFSSRQQDVLEILPDILKTVTINQ